MLKEVLKKMAGCNFRFVLLSASLAFLLLAQGLAQGQSLYEYIKVEETDPGSFSQFLLPTSEVPIEKVVKYEKRLTADLPITREESTITLPKDYLMAVEYRLRYRSGGEVYESLIYCIDYSEVPSGRSISFASPAWLKAYDFIKNYTEKDSLILCWWHHGKRIGLFTGRSAFTSSPSLELLKGLSVPKGRYEKVTIDYLCKWYKDREGTEDEQKTRDLARFFCSKEAGAKELLGLLTPVERPVYVLVSSEDFQEIAAMSRLSGADLKLGSRHIRPMSVTGVAGDMSIINQWIKNSGITSYYAQIFPKHYALWYLEDYGEPEMKETLILKLLPLSTGQGQGLRYFQPVFRSDEAHVWVYKFVPQGLKEPVGSAMMGGHGGHGGGGHGGAHGGGHGDGYGGPGGGYGGHGGGHGY
jgi:hydroxylamine oxidation protein HaoB